MPHYLLFNGDADGICAAQQLLLANPQEVEPITGVKREISLLQRIESVSNAQITVLDISVEKNLPALKKLLDQDCHICWFDHHESPEIPDHPNFDCYIDTQPDINTSLLVSQFLEKGVSLWSIVGLFGDNMHQKAESLARELQLVNQKINLLKELGELLNYNAYGGSIDDLFFHPAQLLEKVKPFSDPFSFLEEGSTVEILKSGRDEDLQKANSTKQLSSGIYVFPNEKWARRVIGIYANKTAQKEPDQAHAVLVQTKKDGYLVSVRSPINGNLNAAEFCSQFPTGGGRKKAAGINFLPENLLADFIDRFHNYYG